MNFIRGSTNGYMKGAEPFFIKKSSEIGILLLHGFTSSPYQFKELANFLTEKNYSVMVPLIAGHGTHPDDLHNTTIEQWQNSVEQPLLELEKNVKKVFIVGHSFGGNLAFYLAHTHANPIQGIVSLGTPIYLRYHNFIKLRTYTYGWLKKYYPKSGENYKADYIDLSDQVSYPVIPTRSLRNFLKFIEHITPPSLNEIKTPTLIIQTNADPVVHPKSAQHIHQNLGSNYKKVYWLNGRYHSLSESFDFERKKIFDRINKFFIELTGG